MFALGILHLVFSRMRHAWGSHLTAISAVAILMATFVTFTAIGAGMEVALVDYIQRDDLDHLNIPAGNEPWTSHDIAQISRIVGVQSVSPKGMASTDLALNTGPLVLVGIDLEIEAPRVMLNPTPDDMPTGVPLTGIGGEKYLVISGRWLEGPNEAVLALHGFDASDALGQQVEIHTDRATRDYTIVGIVHLLNPANIRTPEGFVGGYMIVDLTSYPFDEYGAIDLVIEPRYDTILSVAKTLGETYPMHAFALERQIHELERAVAGAASTTAVLRGIAILTGLVGAGTAFGISSLLIAQEERRMGIMKAIGFPERSIWLYGGTKLFIVTVAGLIMGTFVAFVIAPAVPLPTLTFTFIPLRSPDVLLVASLWTFVFAAAGSGAAIASSWTRDPIDSLRNSE